MVEFLKVLVSFYIVGSPGRLGLRGSWWRLYFGDSDRAISLRSCSLFVCVVLCVMFLCFLVEWLKQAGFRRLCGSVDTASLVGYRLVGVVFSWMVMAARGVLQECWGRFKCCWESLQMFVPFLQNFVLPCCGLMYMFCLWVGEDWSRGCGEFVCWVFVVKWSCGFVCWLFVMFVFRSRVVATCSDLYSPLLVPADQNSVCWSYLWRLTDFVSVGCSYGCRFCRLMSIGVRLQMVRKDLSPYGSSAWNFLIFVASAASPELDECLGALIRTDMHCTRLIVFVLCLDRLSCCFIRVSVVSMFDPAWFSSGV